ncbi:MAG: hypothetical protein HRT61_21950, partial [Ekhidna sp.]|nr:hypothetical protein [Ekhidna sp.]
AQQGSSIVYTAFFDIVATPPTYDGSPFSFSTQDDNAQGFTFSTDGSKVFMVGWQNDAVHSYTLTTPFDITGGVTYDNTPLDISTETLSPSGIVFNREGTIMYIVDGNADRIFQYILSTPFDIAASVSLVGDLNVATQDNDIEGMAFAADGSKLFVIGNQNDQVYQYSLSIPFDVTSGVTYDGNPFSVTSEETEPQCLAFNAAGTKLYVSGVLNDAIIQYNLVTPFDITSGVTLDGSFDVFAQEQNPAEIQFNPSGTKMYMSGGFDELEQFSLPQSPFTEVPANDGSVDGSLIITLTGGETFTGATEVETNLTISNLPSGLTPSVALSVGNKVATITLTGNATSNESSDNVGDLQFTFANGAFTGGDASALNNAVGANTGLGLTFEDNPIPGITYSAPIDIVNNPPVFNGSPASVSAQVAAPEGLVYSFDGSKIFLIDSDDDEIYQYSLTIPFDVSSGISFDGSPLSITAEVPSPSDLIFSPAGDKLYVIGRLNDAVNQYSLATPFDITSGVTFDGSPLSIATEESSPRGLTFNPSGTKLYVIGDADDEVNQYSLATPFEITSGVTFDGSPFSVASEETNPTSITFNASGTKFFIIGHDSDNLNQYSLSTPFDVTSGASFDGSISILSEETFPNGIVFNPSATKFYVTGLQGDDINQYSFSFNVFTESPTNDGSVDGSLIVSLANETFVGATEVESNLTITNLPAGLTPSVALSVGNTVATITLTGNATSNESTDNVADLQFTFSNGAFSGGDASVVNNAIGANTGLGITFDDAAFISYSSPIDIVNSPPVFTSTTFDVSPQESLPGGLTFGSDGLNLYVTGEFQDRVSQYTLTTPFDISSGITFDNNLNVSAQAGFPKGVAISKDGSKLFVVNAGG